MSTRDSVALRLLPWVVIALLALVVLGLLIGMVAVVLGLGSHGCDSCELQVEIAVWLLTLGFVSMAVGTGGLLVGGAIGIIALSGHLVSRARRRAP